MLKSVAQKLAQRAGLEIRRAGDGEFPFPVEFTAAERQVFDYVRANRLTMVSPERLIATIAACRHAAQSEIPGDFVECGVWRGGNSLAAKMVLEHYGSDKRVFLFDTFAGMSEPTDEDRAAMSGVSARGSFLEQQRDGHNDWCFASIEDVQANFRKAGVRMDEVCFIKGDVAETLMVERNVPEAISVLRLDTDWYESTKAEMRILYPRLTSGGTLLIDDFGHWEGARRAIEEYFAAIAPGERPLLHYSDYTGRAATKP